MAPVPAAAPAPALAAGPSLRYSQDDVLQARAAEVFGRLAEMLSLELDRNAGGFGSTYAGGHVTAATIFRRLDSDDSGRVSTREWLTALRRDIKVTPGFLSDTDLWRLYDAIDADKNGHISLREFADFARKTPYSTNFKHQQMMRKSRKPKVAPPPITRAVKGPDRIVLPPPALVRACVEPPLPKARAGNYASAGDWSRLWWLPEAGDHAARGVQVAVTTHMPHLFFAPNGARPAGGWPLLVYLHDEGRSAGRAPLKLVALEGPPQRCGRQPAAETSFVVVSPQKPMDLPWTEATVARGVVALVEALCGDLCDARRVCLTGVGAGGSGCWGLGASTEYDERFACIAPVRGALRSVGLRHAAQVLRDTRVWAFHAGDDATTPVAFTDVSVGECARRSRACVKYTRPAFGPAVADPVALLLPNEAAPAKGESAHVLAYYPPHLPAASMPPLYEWFLTHSRQKAKPRRRTTFARLADPLVFQGRPRPRSAPASRRRPRQAWVAFRGDDARTPDVGPPDAGRYLSNMRGGKARLPSHSRRRAAPYQAVFYIHQDDRLKEIRV